jgi:hypothetical protein
MWVTFRRAIETMGENFTRIAADYTRRVSCVILKRGVVVAIDLLGWTFLAFTVGILTVRFMRRRREADDCRLSSSVPELYSERRKPSDDFHDNTWLPLCKRVEEAAVAKLNRPLIEKERRVIWRSRSALVLEVALNEIESADTGDAAIQLLASLPPGMDRPDPTNWQRGRPS